ncbi:MAG TPA: hypothetical protein V6C99_12120 [Oculatellaceae cyanobacterium]
MRTLLIASRYFIPFILMLGFIAGAFLYSTPKPSPSTPHTPQTTQMDRKIPAGDTLQRPSPMDEPIWHQELLKVSRAAQEAARLESQPTYIRGYW